MHESRWKDALLLLTFLALALLFFGRVTVGGRTMLPADNVFQWEPWRTFREQYGISVPHNALISDLLLENYVWKRFIVNSLRAGELPLWNPYILGGVPFLAAGQHSAMYPLSALFYVLPIPLAYGWFAALHLFLAGTFAYVLARTLGVGRPGSALAGYTFMFSGFMAISNVFPMIVAAAVWLPLILAMVTRITARAEAGGARLRGHLGDMVLGALAVGMVFLAGHPEMYYYVALVSAAYALWRLVRALLVSRKALPVLSGAGALLAMALLGVALGAVQWLPLFELVQHNFRVGSATLEEVLGWAYPPRRVLSLFIPDFFGNPTHHTYFDLFTWRTVPATVNAEGQPINTIYWGVKNYVEGASYVGLLPVVLAGVALLRQRWHKVLFFAWLSVLSLLFVFGSPLYILVYKLPGLSQVHSPFRWIYPYTLCMALLAGMGLDALSQGRQGGGRWARLVAWLTERALPVAVIVCSVQVLLALGISLALKERIAPLAERALRELALASTAYADWRMLYSCWFRNLSVFGVVGLLSGLALALRGRLARRRVWTALVCLVVVGELFFYGYGFFPAADPALIGLRTPAIDLLTSDPELYRITSYVGDEKPFNANAGMFYDIADARGYDSIILKQYAEYMGGIQYQNELPYNRIAPIDVPHTYALDSPLLDGLNVKYVLAQRDRPIARQGYTLVYDGEILIYRNDDYLPRAYLAPRATLLTDRQELLRALRLHDPRESVLLEEPWAGAYPDETSPGFAHEVEAIEYRPNRVRVIVDTPEPAFLVLADNHFQGWEARIYAMEGAMPAARGEKAKIYRANGTFRAVEVPARRSMVQFAFRPQALVVGLAVSAAGLIGLLILTVARLATRRMEARQ